jgi:carbohydrate kinase (thermoresistant glucokinase family)
MTGAVVIMGVSGSGKSTLGPALAEALGWRFIDGDALHPPANVAKMAAGIALDDADRRPFLEGVAQVLAAHRQSGVVVACSALRRSYRDYIRARAGPVLFVLPVLEREALVARLAGRADHFMPSSLLDSQLDLLEFPEPEEQVILVDGNESTELQVGQALGAVRTRGSSANG